MMGRSSKIMPFHIQDGIAIPRVASVRAQTRNELRETLLKMQVGQSFLVRSSYISFEARQVAKELKFDITTRKEGNQRRVWLRSRSLSIPTVIPAEPVLSHPEVNLGSRIAPANKTPTAAASELGAHLKPLGRPSKNGNKPLVIPEPDSGDEPWLTDTLASLRAKYDAGHFTNEDEYSLRIRRVKILLQRIDHQGVLEIEDELRSLA